MSARGLDDRSGELIQARVPFVHARVVRAQRPTSAKPGDEAVVFSDGTIEGFVGGTCAESTVRAQAITLLDTGEPLLLRISPTADEVESAATAPEDGSLTVHNPCLSGGTLEIFLEPVLPQPVLAVHGESPIARALASVGGPLGFLVTAWGAEGTGDAAAVVVASHGREEEHVLAEALRARVPYVGLVASRKRGEAVLAGLTQLMAGDDEQCGPVHTPAGLDIGARTPQEVALSILAEIVAERSRPSGRPVEDRHRDATASAEPATDPVCGMSVAAVEASLHLDHDGRRSYFCGSGCLRAFSADPSSYVQT